MCVFKAPDYKDSINATVVGAFRPDDVINGGAGSDTLTVSDSAKIKLLGGTVSNVEIASFTSDASVDLNTTGWTGLASLSARTGMLNLTSAATTAIAAQYQPAGNRHRHRHQRRQHADRQPGQRRRGSIACDRNGVVTISDANYNSATANGIASVTLNNYGAGSVIRFNTLTDRKNEITTLNVTTSGAACTLAAFTDTGLKNLTVTGTQAFNLGTLNSTLTSIVISGSASFSDGATYGSKGLTGFATLGAAATLTTTSTGRVSVSIDGRTRTVTATAVRPSSLFVRSANAHHQGRQRHHRRTDIGGWQLPTEQGNWRQNH